MRRNNTLRLFIALTQVVAIGTGRMKLSLRRDLILFVGRVLHPLPQSSRMINDGQGVGSSMADLNWWIISGSATHKGAIHPTWDSNIPLLQIYFKTTLDNEKKTKIGKQKTYCHNIGLLTFYFKCWNDSSKIYLEKTCQNITDDSSCLSWSTMTVNWIVSCQLWNGLPIFLIIN